MNIRNRAIVRFLTLILFFASVSSFAKSTTKPKVAVLPFNTAPASKKEIGKSISEMLVTNLGKSKNLILVERLQVAKAYDNFRLEMTGLIDESTAVKVGQWLGATKVIVGNYTQIGRKVGLDSRIIDVKTGTLTESEKVEGKCEEIFDLVDKLASNLLSSFTRERIIFRDVEVILKNRIITFPIIFGLSQPPRLKDIHENNEF